jgi:3-hydroxyacyl-CoA dehydrogenase
MTNTVADKPVRVEREADIAFVVIDNPPVNASSHEVRAGLLAAIGTLAGDPAVSAIVLIGAGRTFIAGADIREFAKPPRDPQLPAVIAAIEQCEKPVIAAIAGAALGGGFELALGCDYRIAASDAVVGLPEVTLGIIPGAGGTQRLPRLTGLATAIGLIASGRRVKAAEAQRLGLVDVVIEGGLRAAALRHARENIGRKRRISELPVPAEPEKSVERAVAEAMQAARGRTAVKEAIASVRNATRMPFAAAAAEERATFQRLRQSEEAAALRYLFFAEREAARVPGISGATPRPVTRVGIVGAGTMGAAISVCFLDSGIPVMLIERDQAALDSGVERIRGVYRRLVQSGRMSAEEMERRLSVLTPAVALPALAQVDLVIEAVFEDMDVKQALMRELARVLKPGAVLASNTSYLDLDALACVTDRPGDCVGLHFFAPANVMRLIEVVRGRATAPDVLATVLALAKTIRKLPVVARVGEGFIGNRIFSAYRVQCELMLEDGAYPEQVDAALVAFGLAMGPFAVNDLSGLDISWRTRQRLAATRDPKARYPEILDRLCEAGRFGQKTGAGWYRYPEGARRGLADPEVSTVIEKCSAAKGIVRHRFTPEQIQWRGLAAMINEAALVLAECIAARPSDVDLVLVNGYGFPAQKGGPLFWASRRPRKDVTAAIDALAAATGHGFKRGNVDSILDQVAGLDRPRSADDDN